MNALFTTCLTCVVLTCTAQVFAESKGDPDPSTGNGLVEELILGESPYPQEAGEFQITLSSEHLQSGESHSTDLILEFEYGLTDSFQVSLEIPYGLIDAKEVGESDVDGIGDIGAGAMWNFLNEAGFVVSAAVEVNFPTGDENDELGEGEAEVEPMLLAVIVFDWWELYGGIGGEFTDDEDALTYSAGVAATIGPVVGLLEFAGVTGTEEAEEVQYIAPGLAASILGDTEFEIGVPIGLNNDSADWGLTCRVVWEF